MISETELSSLLIRAVARLVSKGLAEYCIIDGRPAIRLTQAGKELAAHNLRKEMEI